MIKEFKGEYRFLSNFYPTEIVYDGITYPSSEHAYMAQKTLDPDVRRTIAALPTAGEAKRYGRTLKLRPNWELIKDAVMLDILSVKFAQPILKEYLLATGDQELVEGNWWGDRYWGVCLKTGQGQNKLGKMLMAIRDLHKTQSQNKRQLIYTGIGSRQSPSHVLESMFLIGAQLAESGWTLRSGHADGADLAFEEGCLSANGAMEIFVPWYGFNAAPNNDKRYIRPKVTEGLAEFTSQYHPAWEKCSDAAKLLHMRNACQVFGLGGDEPTDLVICWTKDGKDSGGTGTAIRMAMAHDIPVFNLNVPGAAEQLCAYVLNLESARG